MKFLDTWQAVWLAVAFAEADEPGVARKMYERFRPRPRKRMEEQPRSRKRPGCYHT